jgi:hypothetical protein
MSLVVPATPRPPIVTPGDGLVTISWSAPTFDPGTMRAVVGYILRPYIGTTAQTDLTFSDAPAPGSPIILSKDGDGIDLQNGTAYTFRVAAISSVGISSFSAPSVSVTPTPISQAALTVDPWDYASTRIQFKLTDQLLSKISHTEEPRVAITRSGYGSPVTPLDGTKLLDLPLNEALSLPYHYELTQFTTGSSSWNRPYSIDQSFYDRSLQAGRWYYYSLFLFVDNEWTLYSSDEALVPMDYNHRNVLWLALPEYYRIKDDEFLVPPQTEGDLKRFLNVLGFELDYSRTLAEGIQDIYQVERSSASLVKMLGESNLGTTLEEGLGEIRYRSLVASLGYLYNERGTERGVRDVTLVSSKYRTEVLSGINDMRKADDSDFSNLLSEDGLGAGNWSALYLNFLASLVPRNIHGVGDVTTPFFGGLSYQKLSAGLSPGEYHTKGWPEPFVWEDSPHYKKDGATLGDPTHVEVQSTGIVLCCGAGVSRSKDRHHVTVPKLTYPVEQGIRCVPGDYYTWSAYLQRAKPTLLNNTISLGVLWFGAPTDAEDPPFPLFNPTMVLPGFEKDFATVTLPTAASLNYISRSEQVWTRDPSDSLLSLSPKYPYPVSLDPQADSAVLVPDNTTDLMAPKRYGLRVEAPTAIDYKGTVYAVPYIALQDRYAVRYVACAMFSHESNSRRNYIIPRLK